MPWEPTLDSREFGRGKREYAARAVRLAEFYCEYVACVCVREKGILILVLFVFCTSSLSDLGRFTHVYTYTLSMLAVLLVPCSHFYLDRLLLQQSFQSMLQAQEHFISSY